MKIDLMHLLYVVSMLLLAFVSAIVVTKTVMKFWKKREDR
jgi:hypothetical protein